MLFKLTYAINGLVNFRRDGDLPSSVSIDGDHLLVLYRSPKGRIQVDLIADREPPLRVIDTLRALRQHQLLLDNPLQDGIPYEIFDDVIVNNIGTIKNNHAIHFDLLPSGAKPWLRDVRRNIRDILVGFIKTMRWRQACETGHQPFGFVSIEWSDDGNLWSYVPISIEASVLRSALFDADEASMKEVCRLVASGHAEPFAHELIR